jgi:hypothetical protein
MSKIYFVDSENIGPLYMNLFPELKKTDTLYLFVTQNSPRITYESAQKLFEVMMYSNVEIIHCYTGTNALDFQLISYLGHLLKGRSRSEFVVVSSDHGYEPAVKFWCDKGYKVSILTSADLKAMAEEEYPSEQLSLLDDMDDTSVSQASVQTAPAAQVTRKRTPRKAIRGIIARHLNDEFVEKQSNIDKLIAGVLKNAPVTEEKFRSLCRKAYGKDSDTVFEILKDYIPKINNAAVS